MKHSANEKSSFTENLIFPIIQQYIKQTIKYFPRVLWKVVAIETPHHIFRTFFHWKYTITLSFLYIFKKS